MYWILIVIAFAIMAVREGRKEKRNPGYRSWMTDGHYTNWWWWRNNKH